MRVTSSSCVAPRRNQLDQEPTPINCLVFKERATQLLSSLASLRQQRRGALYSRFRLRQPFSESFLNRLSDLKTTQPFDSLAIYFAARATKDANYTALNWGVKAFLPIVGIFIAANGQATVF